ncbi:MAG: response regulator [Campylobacterota bacterium]
MAKTVVFVDDSKTVLMSAEMAIKPLLDDGKVEIVTYENPLDLLVAVEDGFVYDLVVTDVNMPQMNGLEMAKKLKHTDSVKLKPILALTTENKPELKAMAKEIGLAGWITKPFQPKKLIMGIKRIIKV